MNVIKIPANLRTYTLNKLKIKEKFTGIRFYRTALVLYKDDAGLPNDIIATGQVRVYNVFLTYSKTPEGLTQDYLLEFLLKKALDYKLTVTKYIVARELHKDDGFHLHVVLSFKKQLNHAMNFFDVPFKGHKPYHPNIKYAKPLGQKVLYCAKEDPAYLIKGFNIDDLRKKEAEAKKGDVLEQTISVFLEKGYNKGLDFFLEKTSSKQKGKYATKVASTLKALQNMKTRLPAIVPKYKLEDFYTLAGVENFITAFNKNCGHGAMYIGGISGIGKTHYFEALLTELGYRWITVGNFEELRLHDLNNVDFIIFDDVSFEGFKKHDEFLKLFEHLRPTSIPCRHSNPIIPAGVGRIFLHNSSFYKTLAEQNLVKDQALIRRVYDCVIIHYLSPKIPTNEKTSAIIFQPVFNINAVNSIITINTRDFTIPEYNSVDNKIMDPEVFAEERRKLT